MSSNAEHAAVEAQINFAHIAVVWDATSENKKKGTSLKQQIYARKFRAKRNYELRNNFECTQVLQSHWRMRNPDRKDALKAQVEKWNTEMREQGLESLMFVIEVWGINAELMTWHELEMTAILKWLGIMSQNLEKAIDTKNFGRNTENKYDHNITFLRSVVDQDIPSDTPRYALAVRDLEMVEELFHQARKYVPRKGDPK